MIGSRSSRVPPHYYDVPRASIIAPTLSTLQGTKDWIALAATVIADHRLVAPGTYNTLTTDTFPAGTDTAFGAPHLLQYLDWQLKANKAGIGYTDRLSEASWGEAEPDSLTEADPLDLVTTLEGLGCKVVIVDNDAKTDGSNNLDAASTTGCVRVLRADDNSVRSINGTTVKTTPDDNLFSGSEYQFKFWYTLDDLNESNGGNFRFPNSVTVESIMLVRASILSDHKVSKENQIGARIEKQTVAISGTPTGGTYTLTSSDFGTTGPINWNASSADVQAELRLLPDLEEVTVTTTAGSVPDITHTIEFHGVTTVANPATLTSTSSLTGGTPVINHVATQTGGGQNTRITLRGYTGEWPEIWCGNSTDNDSTPSSGQCPNTALDPRNGTASIFRIGQTTTQYRNNFHVRNIHWHGKRETAGGAWIFCGQDILRFTYGSNCSVRHCKFTDLNPIPNNDTATNKAVTATLVDHANSVRSVWDFNGLHSAAPGFVCDSNYFEGADIDDYPNATNSSVATISTSDSNGGALRFNTTGAHGLTSGDFSVSGHSGFTGNTKLGKFTIASVTANSITCGANTFTGTGGTDGTIRVPPIDGRTGGFCLDVHGENTVVTRNQFRGVMGGAVRLNNTSGLLVEDNIMQTYDGSVMYMRNCSDVTVRRNRIGPHGSADRSVSTASHGIQIGYSSDVLIENNVIYNVEPTNNVASYGIWIKTLEDDPEADPPEDYTTGDITIRSNLLYRTGIFFDNEQLAAADLLPMEWSDNIVAGMAEVLKTKESDGKAYLNAPLAANFLSRTGNVAGTLNGLITITGNQLWRFANATPDQSTVETGSMLAVRNSGAALLSDYYDVDDTLTGWTDNTVAKPDWAGNPEWVDINNTGDFRLTTDPIGFADAPFTEALSHAWEPD